MRLVLHYRGPLKSNGSPSHKHELRQHFHTQLKKLWSQEPLKEMSDVLMQGGGTLGFSLLRPMNSFTFVPLIAAGLNVVAELSISLLRPEPPGGLITQGGDIDNRLKTLFDALTMPPHANALPSGAAPQSDQTPFFCLLEDDNLVTAVSVRTEQLLELTKDPSEVDASIHVLTRVTRQTWMNGIFM